jgi:hypothetical protein
MSKNDTKSILATWKVVTKCAGRCVQLYTNAYWYRVSFVAVTILHVRMYGRTKRHKLTYRTHDDLTLRWRTSFVPRVKHCWYCTTNDSARMLESTDWAPAATSIFRFLWQNLDLHSPRTMYLLMLGQGQYQHVPFKWIVPLSLLLSKLWILEQQRRPL